MNRPRVSLAACVLSLTACAPDSAGPLAPGGAAFDHIAGSSVEVVTEDDVVRQAEGSTPTGSWVLYTRAGTPASAAAFVSDPAPTPEGSGSFRSITTTGANKLYLFNYDHVGTALADVTAISYSSYRYSTSTAGKTLPAINLEIDFNGPAVAGGYSILVFEPIYNNGNAAIPLNSWQSWTALAPAGKWWSSRAINGQCAGAAVACWRSWAQIVANNPEAVIVGGFGINQGSGNAGLTGGSDALHIAHGSTSVTYDFEEYRVAESMDDCKDDGWRVVRRADGTAFRNQGLCVAYTNTL